MKPYIFLLLLFVHTTCMNNVVNDQDKTREIKDETLPFKETDSNKLFKSWLADTLKYLSFPEKERAKDMENKHIIIGEDSLSLTINSYYRTEISEKNKVSGEVSNIVNLLKEYEELPSETFTLSFLFESYYYPSSSEEMKYDFVNEIKDIQVLEKDSKLKKYGFIRGRFTNKEVISKTGESVKTEFIWEGEKLIKR